MTKPFGHILRISLLFILFSCQSHENKIASTYTITRSNFEDILNIDGTVDAVQSTSLMCPRRADGIVTFIIDDGTIVKEGDVVCIVEDNDLKTRYDESVINLESANAELNKNKANLDMRYALLEAQVQNNAAETDIANLDSVQLQYLSKTQREIKELELQKVAIEKAKLQKKLRSLAIINKSELKKSEFQILRHTNDIKSSKEQLDGLIIKATRSGMVSRAMYYNGRKIQVGDNVWNNMAVVTLPDLTRMKVKILASESDFKRINVNDLVEYTFDAMPKNKAWGKIVKKSPVGRPVKQDSKVKVFEIEASIDSALVMPDPEITTNCKVILKRVKDTLTIPQIAIFDQDSMKVVYVLKSDKYEMRQIITGTSSQKSAIVLVGLKPKETISFVKPKSSLIVKKTLLTKLVLKKYNNFK